MVAKYGEYTQGGFQDRDRTVSKCGRLRVIAAIEASRVVPACTSAKD